VFQMVLDYHRSERRACALVGISRDSYRNPTPVSALNTDLTAKIIDIAHARRRAGYRMIHDLLRPQYAQHNVPINAKRVYRLYREAGLAVRKRRKVKKSGLRVPLVQANVPNETWSIDFVFDSLANGRSLKCLTVVDDCTRECVTIGVDFGINALYVTGLLDQVALFRGYPKAIRSDNGPEFISRTFAAWAQLHAIEHILIEPGAPTQNAYVESFNGTFRDECLNENWFSTLAQARIEIAIWRKDYNEVRPHSSCGRIPPASFAATLRHLTHQTEETEQQPANNQTMSSTT
jgi:putative transposase